MISARVKHPSRARVGKMLDRMATANGISIAEAEAKLDAVLAMTDNAHTRSGYLAALCDSWLGHPQERGERSDRGAFHQLPEQAWDLGCEQCGRSFTSSRWDARYCSPPCRQRAYRQRRGAP